MNETVSFHEFCRQAALLKPNLAIILGSGLHRLAAHCRSLSRVPFAQVPGFFTPSVPGHGGWLTLGEWSGSPVLLFEGRLHFYETGSWETVVRTVMLAQELGVRNLILTNAAGGIRPALEPGGFLAIRDQIEWTRPHCWRHPDPGTRKSPYSPWLLEMVQQAAAAAEVAVPIGVYAAVTGPCYETPAEIRALAVWGADAVGMSTAREVEKGRALGLQCAAISCITNRAAGLGSGPIYHEEVLATASVQSERLATLLDALLRRL
jgi:purine-nucleoside phosphorylase